MEFTHGVFNEARFHRDETALQTLQTLKSHLAKALWTILERPALIKNAKILRDIDKLPNGAWLKYAHMPLRPGAVSSVVEQALQDALVQFFTENQGLLKVGTRAEAVRCLGCEERCYRPVIFISEPGLPEVASSTCHLFTDRGPFQHSLERLYLLSSSRQLVSEFVARSLHLEIRNGVPDLAWTALLGAGGLTR